MPAHKKPTQNKKRSNVNETENVTERIEEAVPSPHRMKAVKTPSEITVLKAETNEPLESEAQNNVEQPSADTGKKSLFKVSVAKLTAKPKYSFVFHQRFKTPANKPPRPFDREFERNKENNVSELYQEDEPDVEYAYEIEETEYRMNGSENVNTHQVRMPDFDKHLARRMGNQSVTEHVMKSLNEIIEKANKPDNALAESVYQKVSRTMENNASLDGKNSTMHEVAVAFFDESYNALADIDMKPEKRVIAAQGIADVMLKGYSPIGFVNGTLDKYAEGYVVNNNDLLRQRLMENANLSKEESKQMVDDIEAAIVDEQTVTEPEEEINPDPQAAAKLELKKYAPTYVSQLAKIVEDEQRKEQVREQVTAILRESGFDEENNDINATVDDLFERNVDNIAQHYDPDGVLMGPVSSLAITNFTRTLQWLDDEALNLRNPIVATQRVMDVFLKAYSPVGFTAKGELNKYASNYIIGNKSYLRAALNMTGAGEDYIEETLKRNFMLEYRREIEAGKKYMEKKDQIQNPESETVNDPEQESAPNNDGNVSNERENTVSAPDRSENPLNEPTTVVPPVQEPPKEEPPKEEPPKEEPPKEDAQRVDPATTEPVREEHTEEEPVVEEQTENEPIEEEIPIEDYKVEIPQEEELQPVTPIYSIEESSVRKISYLDTDETENVSSHRVEMPNLNDLLRYNQRKREHVERVSARLSHIIKEAGVTDRKTRLESANFSYNLINNAMNEAPGLGGPGHQMHYVAMQFFSDAYAALESSGLSTKDRIITSQKVADLMMRNYSPAAFVEGQLDQYASRYVINNRRFLQKQLEENRTNPQEIDSLINEVESEIANAPEDDFSLDNVPEDDTDELDVQDDVGADQTDELDPERINVPEVYARLNENVATEELNAQVKKQISDILKESGVEQNADDDDSIIELFDELHEPESLPEGDTHRMHNIVKSVFNETYAAMETKGLTPRNKLVTAQRITDVILKNYSPVTLSNGAMNGFAENYVLQNTPVLRSCLRSLRFTEDEFRAVRHRSVLDEFEEELKIGERFRYDRYLKQKQRLEEEQERQQLQDEQIQNEQHEIPRQENAVNVPQPEQPPREENRGQEENREQDNGVGNELGDQQEQRNDNDVINNDVPDPNQNSAPQQEQIPQQNHAPQQEQDMVNGEEFHSTSVKVFLTFAQVNNALKNGVSEVLNSAGVTKEKMDSLSIEEILRDAYTEEKIPKNGPVSMREITKQVFISTYDALRKKGIETNDKLDTAQKITNQLIMHASPRAFKYKTFDKYSDNYVIGDKDLLRECLTTLNVPENEINAMVAKADKKSQQKVNNTEGKKNPEVNNAEEKKKPEVKKESEPINHTANVMVFQNTLNTFNGMYRQNVDANDFALNVNEAYELMTGDSPGKRAEGKNMLSDLFKSTLKKAFDDEKQAAYNEHRMPDFNDIIKGTNDLFRAAMFAFTDMYHDPENAKLADPTAFGGLSAKEMADISVDKSLWSMDQKSDEAWEIQSKEAKDFIEKWKSQPRPHEAMMNELSAMAENAKQNGSAGRRDVYTMLTAAEWFLVNDEKMMVQDESDPYNKIPNWGNRYWKKLTETREMFGIQKHTSMRDLIQSDYAAMSKAICSSNYNETQIYEQILDPSVREVYDSFETQKEIFKTQSKAISLNEKQQQENKTLDELLKTNNRIRFGVKEEDERLKMKNEEKVNNFILDNSLTKDKSKEQSKL